MRIIIKNIDNKDGIILKKEKEKETVKIKAGENYIIESVHDVHVGTTDKYFKLYYKKKYQHMGCNWIESTNNYWDIKIER